jgi:hypothetical protein
MLNMRGLIVLADVVLSTVAYLSCFEMQQTYGFNYLQMPLPLTDV